MYLLTSKCVVHDISHSQGSPVEDAITTWCCPGPTIIQLYKHIDPKKEYPWPQKLKGTNYLHPKIECR